MANKKLTKRDCFNSLLKIAEVQSNPDLVKFIEHELELLARKNSSDKKPTAQQIENEKVKQIILEILGDKTMTISEMQKSNADLAELTNQRISALLTQMKDSGLIIREEIKRKAHFKRA